MSQRRCAAPGCIGTLPRREGKFCPKCGGTQFLPGRRRASRVVLALIIVAVALMFVNRSRLRSSAGVNVQRKDLIAAREVASRMTMPQARDDAYSSIVHLALQKHDEEYACDVAGDITMANTKDKVLGDIVDDALATHQIDWANKAADEMVMAGARDAALRQIADAIKRGG
jgi:hypothetical protein